MASAVSSKHQVYNVSFYEDRIGTTVTKFASVVDEWIADILSNHRNKHDRLLVGLDTEWRPSFRSKVPGHQPVAILQLCVGRRCLIFQLLHAKWIPKSLVAFLSNDKFTFVGVGIKTDVEKLYEDHGLKVARTMDLRSLAVSRYEDEDFKGMGLKRMAREVLAKEMEKPKHITVSRWDARSLSPAQIEYACIDAFVSFELALRLNSPKQ